MDAAGRAKRNESLAKLHNLKMLAADLIIAQDPRYTSEAINQALKMIFNSGVGEEPINPRLKAARTAKGIEIDRRGHVVGGTKHHTTVAAGVVASVAAAIHEEAVRIGLRTSGLRSLPGPVAAPVEAPRPALRAVPAPAADPVAAAPTPAPTPPVKVKPKPSIIDVAVEAALRVGAHVEITADGRVLISK